MQIKCTKACAQRCLVKVHVPNPRKRNAVGRWNYDVKLQLRNRMGKARFVGLQWAGQGECPRGQGAMVAASLAGIALGRVKRGKERNEVGWWAGALSLSLSLFLSQS